MRYLLSLIMLICIGQLKANTYYFSANSGNDSRSITEAQNIATPWKTIAKLNAIVEGLNGGDSILFQRNEIFEGSILINKSGSFNLPIVFAAYGKGAKPIITGLISLTDWTNIGGGTWESFCSSGLMINTVLINGVSKDIGRYPNLSAPNKGYLTIKSSNGNTQITDPELPASPDWTGGEVVIRKARWVLDRNPITRHAGNTIDYISESPNGTSPNFGYFIQNHPKTLDLTGEWYYSLSDQKLGIYFVSGNPASANIQASKISTLVTINNQSNLVFDNLSFTGANTAAFEMNNAQQVRISNCDILFSGVNAINAKNTNDLSIENLMADHTNNVTLNLDNCSNLVIRNCKIENTGIVAGMGKGDSGGYEAILLTGNNVLIEQNQIENTGYIPITFRGSSNLIRNNFINNFALVKDDGGGIYSWNNIPNAPPNYGTKITSNIILNGKGAPEGTEWPDYYPASGIYMDDNTSNVEITGNTVADCGLYGIYLHNAHEITLEKNTLYNSRSQLVLGEDGIAAYSSIRNMNIQNNIFFAKDASFRTAEFRTDNNDISQFGLFDNNFYCRPIDDNEVIFPSYRINGTYYNNGVNLDQWKALFGKDNSSKKSPVALSSPDLIRFEYNATGTAKPITLNDTYIDVSNNVYAGTLTLEPFTSIVLMRSTSSTVTNPEATCPGTGSILREEWDNISGNNISQIPLATTPAKISQLAALETFNSGEMFGARISGYLCPPQSGNYTFYIAGDDQVELWLSTDENRANKKKIASILNWSGFREFNKFPSQKSAEINLQAGQHYYIEVLHKEGDGGDHVSVAWVLPNGSTESPIPGNRLLPAANPVASGGLNYRYYEGDWHVLPYFEALTPVKSGSSPNVDINVRNAGVNDFFAFVWEGYINIPTPGNYTFETASDDGSKLYFNSFYSFTANALVNNDGLHGPRPATGTVYIPAAGLYPIAMTFFENSVGETMQVYWSGPGIPRQLIPDAAFTNNFTVTGECSGTGSILREQWDDVVGNDVPNIPLNKAPSSSTLVNMMETTSIGDQYGDRMRGYLCPPLNGDYTFFISGDDAVELWLSVDENPANKIKIASFLSWTEFHQFNKFPSQQSAPVNLQAGHRYYIEVLHKEGAGGDHLTVAWQLPDGITEIPIRGNRLLPYTNPASLAFANNGEEVSMQAEKAPGDESELDVYPNPFRISSTIVLNPNSPGEILLEVYDLQGRKLQSFPPRMIKKGVRERFTLKADGLSSGTYIIRLATKTKVMFRKVVISR